MPDAAEAERLAEELEQATRRYEHVLNAIGDGVYAIDEEGRLQAVNPAAARLLGYRPDELAGQPAHETLQPRKADGSPYPRDESPVLATLQDGTVHHVRGGEVLWRRDRTPLPVEYVTAPLRRGGRVAGVLVVFKSVGERQRVEQALREGEERFRRLADATMEGVLIHDKGAILDANEAAAAMLGLNPGEVVGRQVEEFVASDPGDAVAARIRSGVDGTFEAVLRRKDGATLPVEMSARAIPYQGRTVRVTTVRQRAPRVAGEVLSRDVARKIVQGLVDVGGMQDPLLQQVGRRIASEVGAGDIDAFARAYREMGLGDLQLDRDEDGRTTFVGSNLLEKRPGSRVSTCMFTLGYVSEAVSRVRGGEPTLGTEIECESRGARRCRFIVQVKKPEEGLARRVKELV